MATPTLQDLSIRVSAIDGIGTQVPSRADIPVIQTDLNGLHTTINQLTLTLQAQLNGIAADISTLMAGLAGEALTQAVRIDNISCPSGLLSGPFTVNFTAPYLDGAYSVVASAALGEALATAACFVAGVKKQPVPGQGVIVWILNNDSIDHNVTINVFARHD